MQTFYRIPGAEYKLEVDPTNLDTIVVGDIIGDFTEYSAVDGSTYVDLKPFARYDGNLIVTGYDATGGVLFEHSVEIVRPYVIAPDSLSDEERAEFYRAERVARAMIDGLTGGFYFRRKFIACEGSGGDVFPLQEGILRIMRAWENDILLFDSTNPRFINHRLFKLSSNKASIIIVGARNRHNWNSTTPRWAPSDYLYGSSTSVDLSRPYRPGNFPLGYDYIFDVEVGYEHLPMEVVIAVEMLMQDKACMDNYLDKYIVEYDTDQYRIKYASGALNGTGNRRVDMLLSRFINGSGSIRAGVL